MSPGRTLDLWVSPVGCEPPTNGYLQKGYVVDSFSLLLCRMSRFWSVFGGSVLELFSTSSCSRLRACTRLRTCNRTLILIRSFRRVFEEFCFRMVLDFEPSIY